MKNSIESMPWGEFEGEKVTLWRLVNANGLELDFTDWGGRLVKAIVPDRNWLYKCRAGLVRALLKWLLRGEDTFAAAPYNIMPIVLEGESDYIVALVNSSLDDLTVSLDTKLDFTDALTGERVALPVSVEGMSIRYLRANKAR